MKAWAASSGHIYGYVNEVYVSLNHWWYAQANLIVPNGHTYRIYSDVGIGGWREFY